MNSKFYKCCAVPHCRSTTIKTPDKLFIHVPRTESYRKKWLQLAHRDPDNLSIQSKMYFCEDHFDLPNDMKNYTRYRVMGAVPQIKMRSGCLPSKFECQRAIRNLKRQTDITQSFPAKQLKLEIMEISIEPEKKIEVHSVKSESTAEEQPGPSADIPQPMHKPITTDNSIQISMYHKFCSKSTQTHTKYRSNALFPRKYFTVSTSTSPLTLEVTSSSEASTSRHSKSRKLCSSKEKHSDNDTSLCTPSLTYSNSFTTLASSEQIHGTSNEELRKLDQNIINIVKKKSKFYTGVPANCYHLINAISTHTSIPEKHILLCLKKIRLGTKFSELADNFGMSLSHARKIFLKHIPMISSCMQPLIVSLEKNAIISSLPLGFRHKYHHISCIIYYLEIEIQKPLNAVHQALTWSDGKRTNTLKYLISSTPNGLVNYVSPGYGGSTSDAYIVENCNFLSTIEKGSCILADTGFKHIEQIVLKAGHQLVHLPSFNTDSKLSKQQVYETKEIVSLRIHIEKVIQRLREFAMLNTHACINNNLVRVLDEVIIIACALINLQKSIK